MRNIASPRLVNHSNLIILYVYLSALSGIFRQHAWIAYGPELFDDCGIDLVYFSAQPSVQAKFFCEIDYGKKTFPREWYKQNPTLEAVTEWKQLKEMQRVPMVWIRIVEKIDTNSLS